MKAMGALSNLEHLSLKFKKCEIDFPLVTKYIQAALRVKN